ATYDGVESRDATKAEKRDPNFEPTPRYWVPQHEVNDRLSGKGWTRQWLMGWRDITNATNERTLITAFVPLAGCGDKFLLIQSQVSPRLTAALFACLNSLVCDYVARQKLGGTSFKYFIMKQIPVFSPTFYKGSELQFIVSHALELTYT